jgi:hypothetical protein
MTCHMRNAESCDHVVRDFEVLYTRHRDDWIWDECPHCGATWNYRVRILPIMGALPQVDALCLNTNHSR